MNGLQLKKIEDAHGFIAALDQSGGSTPKAGYTRAEAVARLSRNHGMVASFSRAHRRAFCRAGRRRVFGHPRRVHCQHL